MIYNCASPADAQLRRMPCGTFSTFGYSSAAARSLHPSGVNAAFVDGHVSFLNDNIDEFTMAYLISIQDGQAVTPP